MKRIAIMAVMLLVGLGGGARSTHYFTMSQATRTVKYLNAQRELMIYCGYDYEIETYVLVNEVWMERVNSSYYEVWLYGYDAYTGDEVYMPMDLECIWLFSAGRVYNAAQYLRFRVEVRVPGFGWRIPPYNDFTRAYHRHGYVRTYHYEVHRRGWRPPTYSYGPGMPPLPHYYMRERHSEVPMPTGRWTPGVEKPNVAIVEKTRDKNPTTGTVVNSSHTSGSTGKSGSTVTEGGRPSTNATRTRASGEGSAKEGGKGSTATGPTSTTPGHSTATSSRTRTRGNNGSASPTTSTPATTSSGRGVTPASTAPATPAATGSSVRTNTRSSSTTRAAEGVSKGTAARGNSASATRGKSGATEEKVTSARTNTRKR